MTSRTETSVAVCVRWLFCYVCLFNFTLCARVSIYCEFYMVSMFQGTEFSEFYPCLCLHASVPLPFRSLSTLIRSLLTQNRSLFTRLVRVWAKRFMLDFYMVYVLGHWLFWISAQCTAALERSTGGTDFYFYFPEWWCDTMYCWCDTAVRGPPVLLNSHAPYIFFP